MLQKNGGLGADAIYDILRDTAEDITRREALVVPGPGDSVFSPLPAGYDFDRDTALSTPSQPSRRLQRHPEAGQQLLLNASSK